MEDIRLFAYAVGLLGAVVMAALLFRLRGSLGRLFALVMAAWAFNCLSFGVMLGVKVWTGETPASLAGPLWTVNALLLAMIPWILYGWFTVERNGNRRPD